MILFENANLLLVKVKMELPVQEEEYVTQLLATRAILSPKLLIKDHKTINKKMEFSTMLLVPVTNFTTTFSKVGYPEIKKCLDK